MEQRHVENISILIHFMDGLNDPRFDMEKFCHDCNTPACALGWGTTIPALSARGLMTVGELYKFSRGTWNTINTISDVFGDGTLTALFANDFGIAITTPQQWADHAREYLRANGHEVVPADDGFKAFMARALNAVALEQSA